MNKRQHLLAAISAMALGAGSGSTAAYSQEFAGVDLEQCIRETGRTEADCACAAALDRDDPRFFALFLERYLEDGGSNTACVALSTTPPDNRNSRDIRDDNRYGG